MSRKLKRNFLTNMPETRLNPKLYATWDRCFMIFGSLCNGLQNIITEKNKEEITNWAWDFAKEKSAEWINELYAKNEPTGDGQELPL